MLLLCTSCPTCPIYVLYQYNKYYIPIHYTGIVAKLDLFYYTIVQLKFKNIHLLHSRY